MSFLTLFLIGNKIIIPKVRFFSVRVLVNDLLLYIFMNFANSFYPSVLLRRSQRAARWATSYHHKNSRVLRCREPRMWKSGQWQPAKREQTPRFPKRAFQVKMSVFLIIQSIQSTMGDIWITILMLKQARRTLHRMNKIEHSDSCCWGKWH